MHKIYINPMSWIALALALLIVPIPILTAWMVAALVHECCHMLAIKLCRGQIQSIEIGISGARITTGYLSNKQEFFCALAGPLGGFSLLIFAKMFPLLAFFGFLQSLYNLIPLSNYDGGRILRCAFIKLFGTEKSLYYYENIQKVVKSIVLGGVLWCALELKIYWIIFIIILRLYLKIFLAKRSNTQYNRYN